MPLLVALHVTGPFARVAVLPETLNLKRQPSLDVYWRSAPEPLLNVTETRLFCVTGALPGQVTVVVWLPAQDPSQFVIAVITLITAFILNLPEGAGNTAECGIRRKTRPHKQNSPLQIVAASGQLAVTLIKKYQ
ncbi:MAG: hypothetical protein E6J66_19420 [Deltaproteobacteria bacterium]|nr:MAG: hypothetical protein E6J66_19420 [Deltaproteobacteria bacterium]